MFEWGRRPIENPSHLGLGFIDRTTGVVERDRPSASNAHIAAIARLSGMRPSR